MKIIIAVINSDIYVSFTEVAHELRPLCLQNLCVILHQRTIGNIVYNYLSFLMDFERFVPAIIILLIIGLY